MAAILRGDQDAVSICRQDIPLALCGTADDGVGRPAMQPDAGELVAQGDRAARIQADDVADHPGAVAVVDLDAVVLAARDDVSRTDRVEVGVLLHKDADPAGEGVVAGDVEADKIVGDRIPPAACGDDDGDRALWADNRVALRRGFAADHIVIAAADLDAAGCIRMALHAARIGIDQAIADAVVITHDEDGMTRKAGDRQAGQGDGGTLDLEAVADRLVIEDTDDRMAGRGIEAVKGALREAVDRGSIVVEVRQPGQRPDGPDAGGRVIAGIGQRDMEVDLIRAGGRVGIEHGLAQRARPGVRGVGDQEGGGGRRRSGG